MTTHTGTMLGGVFQSLRDVGAFQFVLFPLLTFVIVYGVLQQIGVFDDRNDIDAVIALVIAAFAAIYVPVGGSMVVFLSNMLGAWAIVLVVILLALTGAGLVGIDVTGDDWSGMQKAIGGLALLALAFVFLSWGGVSMIAPSGLQAEILLTKEDMVALAVVALGAGAIWYVGFADRGEEGGSPSEDEGNG